MKKLYFLLIFSFFYACSNPIVMHKEGENCNYDTECTDGLSCINKICTNSQECLNHTDCKNKEGCTDNSCLCKLGSCTPYFPCDTTDICAEKEICSNTENYPFYECTCDDNYIKNIDTCEFDCSNLEHSHTNSSNSGCSCDEGYLPKDGKCSFNCTEFPLKETNSANNGCICKTEYEEIAGECIFRCDKEHSVVNGVNNGCNCEFAYWKDENDDCKYNCSDDINSIVNESNDGCICKEGYKLKNGLCTYICDEYSTVNDTNDGCTCNENYFLNQDNKCVSPCTNIICPNSGTCEPISLEDYSCTCPCQNGGVCLESSCDCSNTGFEGENCETDINECELNIDNCEDNCINTEGSFRCGSNILFMDNFNDSSLSGWTKWGRPLPHQTTGTEFEDGYGVSTGGDANYHSGLYTNDFLLDMNTSFVITARVKERATSTIPWDIIQFGIGARTSGYSDTNAGDYAYIQLRHEITSGQYETHDRTLVFAVSGSENNLSLLEGNDMQWHIYKIEYRKTVSGRNIKMYQDDILKIDVSDVNDPPEINLPLSIHGRDYYHGNFIDWIKVESL